MDWIQFLNSHLAISLTLIGIIGLIIGSFLNVVIYRYPIMLKNEWKQDCLEYLDQKSTEVTQKFNLVTPRSRCPSCDAPIKAWQNIPVISYLILGGKCAKCRATISPWYPIIEIITAVASVVVILRFGISTQGIAAMIFTWTLIALSAIDIQHQILPDNINISLLWLGLLANCFYVFAAPTSAIIGATVGYCILWLIAKLFKLLRKVDGMGHGDFKMFAMLGAWLGVGALLNIVLAAAVLALLVGICLLFMKRMSHQQPLPFGPFLAIGGWFTLIYGPFIVNLINGLIR